MNTATIQATLGLDSKSWSADVQSAGEDVKRFSAASKETAAVVASLERAMRSAAGSTEEQAQKLKAAKDSLSQYNSELKQAERSLKTFQAAQSLVLTQMPDASRPNPSIRVRAAGGGEASGPGFSTMQKMELGHSARAVVGGLAAGADPATVAMYEAPRLVQALGASMSGLLAAAAPLIALIGGGALAKWLNDAHGAAVALRKETAAIGTDLGDSAVAGAQDLDKALAEATAQVDKVRAANSSTKNFVVNSITGGGVRDIDVQIAEQKRNGLENRAQDAQQRDFDISKRAFNGDSSVEADRLQVEYAQKRNEIIRKTTADNVSGGLRALAIAKEEYDLKLATLERTQEANAVNLKEQRDLMVIRASGNQVETELPREKLNRANERLANGPSEGPQHDALQLAADEAQAEYDQAVKVTGEKKAQLGLETQIANLRGSADQVQAQTLALQRADIERRLQSAKPDDKQALERDLAVINGKQDAARKAVMQKAVEFEKQGIAAETGNGPAEQARAIERRLGEINTERSYNTRYNGGDGETAARLDNESAELKKALENLNFTEDSHLSALRANTSALERGNEGVAEKKNAVNRKYDPEIAKAEHDNDPAAAAELRRQKWLELHDVDVQEEMLTPAERTARAQRNRNYNNASARVNSRDKLRAERNAANAEADPIGEHLGDMAAHMPDHVQIPFYLQRPNDVPNIGPDKHSAGSSAAGPDWAKLQQDVSTIAQNCIFKEQ